MSGENVSKYVVGFGGGKLGRRTPLRRRRRRCGDIIKTDPTEIGCECGDSISVTIETTRGLLRTR